MARPKRFSGPARWPLYSRNTARGWSLALNITYAAGERRVLRGTAIRVYDCNGAHAGYQFRDPQPVMCDSDQTPAAITAHECEMNAGLMGASHSAHLDEEHRLKRIHGKNGHALPAEDAIELARIKVLLWRPAMRICMTVG